MIVIMMTMFVAMTMCIRIFLRVANCCSLNGVGLSMGRVGAQISAGIMLQKGNNFDRSTISQSISLWNKNKKSKRKLLVLTVQIIPNKLRKITTDNKEAEICPVFNQILA